jgi:hypothetical protein
MDRLEKVEKTLERIALADEKREVAIDRLFESLDETKSLIAELAISDKIRGEELDKLLVSQKEVSKQLGGIGNSNGEFAESFFYYSLKEKMKLGPIKFDEIDNHVKHRRKGLVDEFDVVLYNGDSIGLVEVKYTAKATHVKNLITAKAANFKTLFPEYLGYKLYLGIAGFSFENEGVKKEAREAGVAILEVQGNHLEIEDVNMIAY